MTTLLTTELIARCHAGSRAKGFWPEGTPPPQGQQLMLVISELAEALEAHRKGRTANIEAYEDACAARIAEWAGPSKPKLGDMCTPLFEGFVKDSVGDELADAYIRLCDFAGGYALSTDSVIRHYKIEAGQLDLYPDNFGTALLGVTMFVCSILEEGQSAGVGTALAALEWVATREGIDLATHIDLKLRYNATRATRHGKAY